MEPTRKKELSAIALVWFVVVMLCLIVYATTGTASAAHWVAGTADADMEGYTVTAYIVDDQGVKYSTSDIVGLTGSAHYENYYMIDIEMIPYYHEIGSTTVYIELEGANNWERSIVTVNLTDAGWTLAPIMSKR